jgi:two-component system chemotaxis response regulator CheY
MCSAMGQQAMVVDAIQNGAKDFINKPFHPQKVVEILRRVLR